MKSNKIDLEIRDLLLDTEEVVISASQDRVARGGSIQEYCYYMKNYDEENLISKVEEENMFNECVYTLV
jgi:hypothetical protein